MKNEEEGEEEKSTKEQSVQRPWKIVLSSRLCPSKLLIHTINKFDNISSYIWSVHFVHSLHFIWLFQSYIFSKCASYSVVQNFSLVVRIRHLDLSSASFLRYFPIQVDPHISRLFNSLFRLFRAYSIMSNLLQLFKIQHTECWLCQDQHFLERYWWDEINQARIARICTISGQALPQVGSACASWCSYVRPSWLWKNLTS